MTDPARPAGALQLAGGWCWFDRVERIERGGAREVIPAGEVPDLALWNLTTPRPPILGLSSDRPRIMGIVNVTPDSFSDGGAYFGVDEALAQARRLADQGADILDIGGESTRPGAGELPAEEEIARVRNVVESAVVMAPVSIDTRKAIVAAAAISAGAGLVNDVSALTFDPRMGRLLANSGRSVCLMHARGTPEDMQERTDYEDVLLDVYDGLAQAMVRAEAAGIARHNIVIDPGIGFAKTTAHNLAILRGLSLFHGLGVPVLLGASRKGFIGTITGVETARDRIAGSLAIAQAAILQGVQIIRAHDTDETRQVAQMTGALIGHEGWRA